MKGINKYIKWLALALAVAALVITLTNPTLRGTFSGQTADRAIDTVNIGATANDGTGDPLRTAFAKVNDVIIMLDSLDMELLTNTEVQNLKSDEIGLSQADSTGNAEGNYVTRKALKDSINVNSNHLLREIRALGSDAIAIPIGANSLMQQSSALGDAYAYYVGFYLPNGGTITGVKFVQHTQGVYTADAYNGIGLYSHSGSTLTKITETVNNGDIWKGTAYSLQTAAFPSPYVAAAGVYYVAFNYNTSAQTTAPSILHWNLTGATSQLIMGASANKATGTVAAQAALPATETMADIANALYIYGMYLY